MPFSPFSYLPNQLYWNTKEFRVVRLIFKQGEKWNVELSTGNAIYTSIHLDACTLISHDPKELSILLRAEIGFLEKIAQSHEGSSS